MRATLVCAALLCARCAASEPSDAWEPLRSLLARWPYTDNFLIQVGNASGLQFEFVKGNMTRDAHVGTASTSKWPSAMAIAGAVADGSIRSLDSKVSEYVPWWSTL